MFNFNGKRFLSFFVIISIYISAYIIGCAAFCITEKAPLLLRLAAGDFAAMLVVWLMGVFLNNSSVYDPYWSIAPIVIVLEMMIYFNKFNFGTFLLMFLIAFWGIRLTANWAVSFQNLATQDWRYDKYKREYKKLWFLINLFGINIMPTAVVYFVCVPAVLYIETFSAINLGIIAGALVCLFAAVLQLLADEQMRRFRINEINAGKVNNKGIWKYSRHPNYLAEILMWWGVYIMMLFAAPVYWYMAFAPVLNMLLFMKISIPLMEKRQLSNKPGYAVYMQNTGMLLPKIIRKARDDKNRECQTEG